jgi:hypothetical protein
MSRHIKHQPDRRGWVPQTPIAPVEKLAEKIGQAALGQSFGRSGAVTFVWTAIPYRMEWRYGPASYKVIAVDAGHVAQNRYLACEAIDGRHLRHRRLSPSIDGRTTAGRWTRRIRDRPGAGR